MDSKTIREKLAELTKSATCQTDIDAIVSRAGGLGGLRDAEFAGSDVGAFMYEWEAMKMAIKKQTRSN